MQRQQQQKKGTKKNNKEEEQRRRTKKKKNKEENKEVEEESDCRIDGQPYKLAFFVAIVQTSRIPQNANFTLDIAFCFGPIMNNEQKDEVAWAVTVCCR